MLDNTGLKKAVVILGAGVMQIPAIKSAACKGLVTIAFDGNCSAQGRDVADHFENIDLKDCQAMLEKCVEYRRRYALAGVFTAGTDFSYAVAWLAGNLGLKTISYETALTATDKSKMRAAFRKANVPSPLFFIADRDACPDETVEKACREIGFPLVVKPVDSMGARGTVRVEECGQLADAVAGALLYSRSGRAIIEQYISGPEFSLDAVVRDGEIHICGLADRHIYFPPYFVEMGHTMPSAYPPEVTGSVIKVFCEGIRAIGIDNGAAKGDIKYSDTGAVVGEIAARLSGGYMSGWTFPYATGYSVIDAAMDIATGRDPGEIIYSYENTSAERAFISVPGVVESVLIPDYVREKREDSLIRDLFVNVRPGDRVNFPRNNVEKCGNVISAGRVREDAVKSAEKACRDIVVRLKPGDEKTFNFIFRHKEDWIPDAFDLRHQDFVSMKDFYGSSERFLNNDGTAGTANLDTGAKLKALLPSCFIPENCNSGRDWQGRSLKETLAKISEITGLEYTDRHEEADFTLGKVFWKSIERAGVQGGIWIADTVIKYLVEGRAPERMQW